MFLASDNRNVFSSSVKLKDGLMACVSSFGTLCPDLVSVDFVNIMDA